MGKYTTYNQNWIDKTIDKHLKVAVKKIKIGLPKVLSIILVGGFGRGEGSVRLEENQKVIPINDYDIYLIVEEKINEEKINKVAQEIEREVGSKGYSLYGYSKKEFYFDIRVITKKKLSKLLPLIKYYEMKYASILVDGDDLRKLIPEFDKDELPFSDGLRFLLNRISHITEWFSINYIKDHSVENWEKETLIYDISKTYLEFCTVLTLLKGYYQPTYQGRLNQLKEHQDEFEELWQKYPDLLNNIEYFTNQKLRPNFKEIQDIKKTWMETREYALGILEFILSKKYKAKSWKEFKKITNKNYFKPYLMALFSNYFKLPKFFIPLLNFLLHKYLNIIWFFRLIKFKKKFHWPLVFQFTDPGILIFYASLFIIQVIKKDGSLDEKMMSKGIEILKSIYPIKEISYNLDGYDDLRKTFSDIWRLYYFQKII